MGKRGQSAQGGQHGRLSPYPHLANGTGSTFLEMHRGAGDVSYRALFLCFVPGPSHYVFASLFTAPKEATPPSRTGVKERGGRAHPRVRRELAWLGSRHEKRRKGD